MNAKRFSPAGIGLLLLVAGVVTPVEVVAGETAPPPRLVKPRLPVAPPPRSVVRLPVAPPPHFVVRPTPTLEYNRDVRPILAENCFACHGPDSAARKADLRIDRRDDAIASGVLVPWKPDASSLVERVCEQDPDVLMPPPRTNKKLTAAQKETLRKWVAEGANYQLHWSFIPPTRPPVPVVKNKAWVRNPIDAFVLAKLEAAGLKPAPEADRRTLARRLALDLTGLPADPADVEAFVTDKSADYYEKYVDKLLASPHWGEHRGRHWLDYARYGDTHGIHIDNYREIWAYRDWVIRSFNENMTFDEFTIEQLAGDLLPKPTLDQLVATGFNRCNITTSEGGAISEEYLVLYARDRTETTSAVWMGLTTGCAVCHDHKYDPITMRDFYSLSAFFNNTTQNAMDGNIKDTPPVIPVPKGEDRQRYAELRTQLGSIRDQLAARKTAAKPEFDKWAATATPGTVFGKNPLAGLRLHAPLTDGEGSRTSFAIDGQVRSAALGNGFAWGNGQRGAKVLSVKQTGSQLTIPDVGDFDRAQPYTASAWVKLTRRNATGAIVARMDPKNKFRGWDVWVEGEKVGMHLIEAFPDSTLKVVTTTQLAFNKWNHVAVSYDGSGKPEGMTVYFNGQPQPTIAQFKTLKPNANTHTTVPLTIGSRFGVDRLTGGQIEDLRVYEKALTQADVGQLAQYGAAADAVARPTGKRSAEETAAAFDWWLTTFDKSTRELDTKVAKLRTEEATLRARGTIAHVMTEKPGEPGAFVLFRGEYDKRRDPVKADTPKSMPPMSKDAPRNRLGLAKWLVSRDHPLTARVTVNRFWQEVFGTGIVRTSGDFGVSGELPSHPKLLDWLAMEFREPTVGGRRLPATFASADQPSNAGRTLRPWDIKQFFKLIVTSATYRQSARTTPEKLEKDRENLLLSRGPRFRMDAEMIRDQALAASGLLVRKLGGPSVRPYQPEGVWEAVAMIGSNTRNYKRDDGENLYRRSMYTFWKRSAPPAAMEILNAPSRETCTVRRERTDTPLQALLTLNSEQFVEAARVLAEKAIKASPRDEVRVDFAVKRLLSRPLRPEEMLIVRESLTDLRDHYRSHPDEAKKLIAFGEAKADASIDPAELAAWTMIVNQFLNLDEVLNK